MAVLARLSRGWHHRLQELKAHNMVPRIQSFLGDGEHKEFFYFVQAIRAPRDRAESELIRVTILGPGDGIERCSWTVSPNNILTGGDLYGVGRHLLRHLGQLRLYRPLRLRGSTTLNDLSKIKKIWHPNYRLPRRRLSGKASRLSHTLKLRMKSL